MPPYLIPPPDGVPWLTLLLLVPLAGVVLIGLAGMLRLDDRLVKAGTTAWMLLPIGIGAMLWRGFDAAATSSGQATIQFVERVPWVQAIRVDYFVGVDGISLPMVLLTVVMAPVAALASWKLEERVKSHYVLLFLLEMAMIGFFISLDFFFFFIFWEFSLVPAYFLIRGWGRENRNYAAFKFFIYTMAGSAAMLLLFQFLYLSTRYAGNATFDLIIYGRLGQGLEVPGFEHDLQGLMGLYAQHLGVDMLLGSPHPSLYSAVVFWAIFMAFAVKLAVWPFHTWLPDAYGDAPISGSILLSAVMSKMGAYGMLRLLLPFAPEAAQQFAPIVGGMALVGIVAGAFGALSYARGDIKRLIGYTSINHMGYVMLAIAAAAAAGSGAQDSRAIALNGAMMQMVAHGLSTGGLFFLAGALYTRTKSYDLSDFGGLRTVMPGFAGVMGILMFANLGLPGLAGFVGEFFIFRGAWATLPLFTALATIGLIVTALALLLMYQRIFLGPVQYKKWGHLKGQDIQAGTLEFWVAAPLITMLLVLGVYPMPIMTLTNTMAMELARVFL
jgi:NADH-quinone oxidoreductase subunit M